MGKIDVKLAQANRCVVELSAVPFAGLLDDAIDEIADAVASGFCRIDADARRGLNDAYRSVFFT